MGIAGKGQPGAKQDNAIALTRARRMHYHGCTRPSTPEITMPATLEAESTLTDRYQTTVPETVRRALRLRKRDKIHYDIRPSGEVVLTRASDAEADDPVLGQFLGFLAHDIATHPDRLQSVSSSFVQRVQSLVSEVNVDLDAPLSADDE
jgi:antitoxin PrlF